MMGRKDGKKPLPVRIAVGAATVPALTAAVFLIFGEVEEGAALCRAVGWGFAQLVCLAGGCALLWVSAGLWKWSHGSAPWDGKEG